MPVCRVHGAHKRVARGAEHGAYKGAGYTKEELRARRAQARQAKEELRLVNELEALAKKSGILVDD